ncbi:MAG: hypothetical protein KDD10_20070 [Phaeodactylibacter sp.]|nr:hypothetical protein [Phaeodactylibacter sp.]MCB9296494.1 hypothetical protein [Lewinellaceae bacterium]
MKKFSFSIIALSFILVLGCKKNDDSPSNAVTILGCNKVEYRGNDFTINCAPGVVSFQVTTTQNGNTASFMVECESGCLKTVTPN